MTKPMAMTCEQIDDQMIDFLYGELSVEARAAFEAHLGGCERCRREVESFGRARTLARSALDEAPPAHLRTKIVDAARAPLPVTTEPARAGFWAWMRAHWTFPALATVGAVAIVLLGGRVLLDPNRTAERGSAAVAEYVKMKATRPSDPEGFSAAPEAVPAAPGLAAPAATPLPAETARASFGASRVRPSARVAATPGSAVDGTGAPHGLAGAPRGQGAGGGAFAKKSAPVRVAGPSQPAVAASRAGAGAEAELSPEKSRGADRDDARSLGSTQPEARKVDRKTDRMAERQEETPSFAEPPPRAESAELADEEGSGARSAVRRPRALARISKSESAQAESDLGPRDKSGDDLASGSRSRVAAKGYPAPPSAAAPPSPPPPTSVAGNRAVASAGAPAAPMAPAPASAGKAPVAPPARERSPDTKDKISAARAETLVQRADRLFTEGRWVEAAVAYRDLLRQDPTSPDAPRWRRRLEAAQSATARTRVPQAP